MKVVLSDGARDDLKQIGDFIARDDPIRAESFVEELLDKARELGEFPKRFPVVPRYVDQGVRRRTHGSYLIFYRIEAERVLVLKVSHGARDYETLLALDD